MYPPKLLTQKEYQAKRNKETMKLAKKRKLKATIHSLQKAIIRIMKNPTVTGDKAINKLKFAITRYEIILASIK